ncbi:hypothetical protein CCP3SC1AL1_520013 [Gammaproteobacteria bacterium]
MEGLDFAWLKDYKEITLEEKDFLVVIKYRGIPREVYPLWQVDEDFLHKRVGMLEKIVREK